MTYFSGYSDQQVNEYPSVTVLSQRRSKTRKPHACSICRKDIPVGAIALRFVLIEDGTFISAYDHERCYYGPSDDELEDNRQAFQREQEQDERDNLYGSDS